jgi:hypothetical protein
MRRSVTTAGSGALDGGGRWTNTGQRAVAPRARASGGAGAGNRPGPEASVGRRSAAGRRPTPVGLPRRVGRQRLWLRPTWGGLSEGLQQWRCRGHSVAAARFEVGAIRKCELLGAQGKRSRVLVQKILIPRLGYLQRR